MAVLTLKDKRELRELVLETLRDFQEEQKQKADTPIRAEEVASLTGWSIKTIYAYKSKLKGWKCGTTLFFSRKFILSYIEQNKPNELKYAL